MQRVKYSIIVHAPTDDVNDSPGFEQLHCSFAIKDLKSLHLVQFMQLRDPGDNDQPIAPAPFPEHIINYFIRCEENGHYRAELLEGAVKYCMYIQPEYDVAEQKENLSNLIKAYDAKPI